MCKYIYSDDLLQYRFGNHHPFNQMRVKMTTDLLRATGTLTSDDIVIPRIATDNEIMTIHRRDYVQLIKQISTEQSVPTERLQKYGLNTDDTPTFAEMHEYSKRIVGASLTAVDLVMSKETNIAVSLAGGLHHGFTGRAGGFCIYNDSSIAIQSLINNYNQRVLYIDTDAHHGDGVQESFYHSNQCLTYSIHETGKYLFPGTGRFDERGIEKGFGYAANIPLEPFTTDESFIHCLNLSLRRIIESYKPDIIVSVHGVDGHHHDPLTHLSLSMFSFQSVPRLIKSLADEYTNGQLIILGGGGYNIWNVVPKAWAHIWYAVKDLPPPTGRLPEAFIKQYEHKSKENIFPYWHDSTCPFILRTDSITESNKIILNRVLNYFK
ncbi:acetoin utilization protein AcuC [Abyssicoccus albus]|uniref:acetoin utilization protein AcuC n=1 Tax=Abyssicoccus albus TaxID=1817405 RepID=UPI00097E3FCE|nr:acetoin utilization protein AcuC [Abyssicoccus albus]AQL55964.1 acetoin utilization protein AcuC [Abyssicoccus albus]